MNDFSHIKAKLVARRAELDARLHVIDDELESHNNPDWDELAVEREGDEVLEEMGWSGLAEISMIDAALVRIEEGTFGACTQCGEAISPERLDVLPFTPFCKTCAFANDAAKH